MRCGLDLCIYNSDNACVLQEISIDESGSCDDCILVSIEKEELESYKKNLLEKYMENR